MLRANSLFMQVCYHPEEHHVLSVGTDRNIAFWEVFDGSLIREVPGSITSAINAVDISVDGKYLLTGGNDKLVKV